MFKASCHCGNVELIAKKMPINVTSCKCSICYKYSVLWAYFSPNEVKITFRGEPTKTYSWLKKVIDFHHCPICGCVTHYSATDVTDWECVAINAKMGDPEVVGKLTVIESDGP